MHDRTLHADELLSINLPWEAEQSRVKVLIRVVALKEDAPFCHLHAGLVVAMVTDQHVA